MPFVSDQQRKACYAQQRRMNEMGMVSNWDCKEYEKGKDKMSPRVKRRQKTSPKKLEKINGEQVYQGVRGGKFVIRKNRKVYM